MKQKKEHRIYRVSYSQKRDAFETFFYVGEKQYPDWEDFSFEASSKCFRFRSEAFTESQSLN